MKTCRIDDDSRATSLTGQLLRAVGFANAICTFQSAKKALDKLLLGARESLVPRVAFLGLNVPGMSG